VKRTRGVETRTREHMHARASEELVPPLSSEASSRRMNKEDGKVKRGSQGKKDEKDATANKPARKESRTQAEQQANTGSSVLYDRQCFYRPSPCSTDRTVTVETARLARRARPIEIPKAQFLLWDRRPIRASC
jgi:hypothetical protein